MFAIIAMTLKIYCHGTYWGMMMLLLTLSLLVVLLDICIFQRYDAEIECIVTDAIQLESTDESTTVCDCALE